MKKLQLTLGLILSLFCYEAFAQCGAIRQQRNITFNTDKDCAPVTVTDFTITYFFNVPQDPNDIRIRFEWNDPSNSVDEYGIGDPQFSVDATNTEFTATGSFTYPEDENCVFEPASYVIAMGTLCETSEQIQLVTSWADDNSFGGVMDINPNFYDVCYNNAIVDAVFADNSTFNCNINQNQDTPNRQERFTQFVYGTNHNAAGSIRNLSMIDGGGATVNLTDGAANLSSTTTINGVTGAYFGPIDNIPFPADGPISVTFPISAPADVNNLVGNVFEITLFNWNICNPYNGNSTSPNYDDAVQTQAYIRIVDPPVPDFQTRLGDASGSVETVFCLGDDIYFENLSTNATDYTWEFYDDNSGTSLLSTSNASNPTFNFNSPGDKLVRLTADNNGASGNCEEFIERIITLSPSAIANIGFYDPSLTNPIEPVFCSIDGTQMITVGFKDETTNIEPMTEWRWEFYDQNGVLQESFPSGAGAYGPQVTDFTRDYTTQGGYPVRLIARNNTSGCQSVAEDTVWIYDTPEASYDFDEVCEGERTPFYNLPDSVLSLNPRVNDDYVGTYQWDFSYDGTTFNAERTTSSDDDFSFYLSGNDLPPGTEPANSVAGSFTVALRIQTAEGNCSDIIQQQVTVNPLPEPILSSGYTQPICPGEVQFTNGSDLGAAFYTLIITDSLSTDSLDFNQSSINVDFQNDLDTTITYYVSLHAGTSAGCEATEGPLVIEVLPSAASGFDDPNYIFPGANCSIWESVLVVDESTQDLDADSYTWTISDANGVMSGYPIIKNSGDSVFHQLSYSVANNTSSNQVFIVNLEVEKAGICITGSQREYLINPSPQANFTVNAVDSCEYREITVEADQPGLSAYDWDFDPAPDDLMDENNRQILTYFRPSSGSADLTVDVLLVTENLAGCLSDTVEASLEVNASEPLLTADFQLDDNVLMQPDSAVGITNLSSNYGGVSYLWDFGDGTTSSVFEPGSHVYNNAGTYQISLVVSNSYCMEEITRQVTVQPADPIIDFTADTLQGCSPLTVQFTNLSRFAVDGSYVWDFGDGNTSTANNPVHTYNRGGVYTVSLYGENNVGNGSDTVKTDYIQVTSQPVAGFEANPTRVRIPDQEVYFKNTSRNATAYHWDFGDGNTSQEEQPIHQYDTLGTYDIQLVALNDLECSDTLTITALVEAIPGGQAQIPNAFSPSLNGPGSNGSESGETINDVFIPHVEGVTEFRMLIYNKWGELLFESNDQTAGWDGYYRGQLQPSDVYVYKLELTYTDGREGIKVGDVTLVR